MHASGSVKQLAVEPVIVEKDFTDLFQTVITVPAFTTRHDERSYHPISRTNMVNPVPDFKHNARHFMPKNRRAWECYFFLNYMQIGVAHTAGSNIDEHFTGFWGI